MRRSVLHTLGRRCLSSLEHKRALIPTAAVRCGSQEANYLEKLELVIEVVLEPQNDFVLAKRVREHVVAPGEQSYGVFKTGLPTGGDELGSDCAQLIQAIRLQWNHCRSYPCLTGATGEPNNPQSWGANRLPKGLERRQRLRVPRGSAGDPLNLIQVMLAEGLLVTLARSRNQTDRSIGLNSSCQTAARPCRTGDCLPAAS